MQRQTLLCLALLGWGSALSPVAPISPVLMLTPSSDSAMLLGGVQDHQWRGAKALAPKRLGDKTYRALNLAGFSRRVALGAAPKPDEPCPDTTFLPVKSGGEPKEFEVLTTAQYNLQPRPVVPLPNSSPVYREIVRSELQRRGLSQGNINITRLLKADLDGNGTTEIIIEANWFKDLSGGLFPPPVGNPNEYSLLLLRSVKAGKAMTTVLGEHLAPKTPWNPDSSVPMPMANLYKVAGLADLNGDGRMEIVRYNAYYEGAGFSVLEWTPAGGAKVRLDAGCGV